MASVRPQLSLLAALLPVVMLAGVVLPGSVPGSEQAGATRGPQARV
jgi:hypothetical protein